VTFTGPVLHESDQLRNLYRGARVHVLPSWFETTGLVSLEAALSGCSVVSTSLGHAREYLGDLAWYCDPREPASILAAVRQAWGTPPSSALRQRVLDHYTWKHVADATIEAYGTLAGRRGGPICRGGPI
jgi:glycosyltransferase involved in cell wall biosynthesis